jgi:hypothetical protein
MNIVISLVTVLVLLFSIIGYGKLTFQIIFGRSYLSDNIGEFGLFGIIFISFISTFLHFFFPINALVSFVIHFIGIFLFLLKLEKKFFTKKKILIFIILVLISLFMLAYHKPNEDWGYYHLPYLMNFISEKVIFGLSTLHVNQGWNSMWLNFTGTFNLPLLSINGFHFANIIFFFFLFNFFLYAINRKLVKDYFDNIEKFFCLVFLLYFTVKFSRLNTYGFDIPSNFFAIVVFYLFIKFFISNNIDEKNFIFQKAIIYSLYSVLIKLSNALIVLLPLAILFFGNAKIFTRSFLFCVLFFFIWAIQQFIYTGCFLFPVIQTCLDVSWYNPGAVQSLLEHTIGMNKSFTQYKGTLSEFEYSRNFNWVPTWFERTKVEMFEHFFTFLFLFLLVMSSLFFSKKFISKKLTYVPVKKITVAFFLLLFIISIQILFWFTSSPLVRFGFHYILLFIFFIMAFPLKKFFLKELNIKFIYILIFLALLFNFQKNIFRIKNDIVNNYFFFYSYPKTTYHQEFTNLDINNLNYLSKDSLYCWNVPAICSYVSSLRSERINNYIFIK